MMSVPSLTYSCELYAKLSDDDLFVMWVFYRAALTFWFAMNEEG